MSHDPELDAARQQANKPLQDKIRQEWKHWTPRVFMYDDNVISFLANPLCPTDVLDAVLSHFTFGQYVNGRGENDRIFLLAQRNPNTSVSSLVHVMDEWDGGSSRAVWMDAQQNPRLPREQIVRALDKRLEHQKEFWDTSIGVVAMRLTKHPNCPIGIGMKARAEFLKHQYKDTNPSHLTSPESQTSVPSFQNWIGR